jgi:transposase
MTTAATPHE